MSKSPQENETKVTTGRGLFSFLLQRASKIILSGSELSRNIRDFGSWFEFEISQIAEREDISEVTVTLGKNEDVKCLKIENKEINEKNCQFPLLWSFLAYLNIDTLKLDVRLERNQIEDIIGFLHCYKKKIAHRNSSKRHRSFISQLLSDQGLHLACADTMISDNTLKIKYSYCSLTFSKVTHWFEEKNKRFHDHRTFFYTAPRYSLIISAIVIGPVLLYSLETGHTFLSLVILLSTILLIALIYVFFMMVGSIEYDNEEKAYQLKKANIQLRRYLERIQAGINKAKIIQEKFLPDVEEMPFKDKLDWGVNFKPAENVGGDFFDVSQIGDNKLVILFCDVIGHGMSAAFITAIVKTTFQSWLDNVTSIKDLAVQLNYNLTRLTPIGSFAAVFLATYDISSRKLTYANCGHQPEPLHISNNGKEPIRNLSSARNMLLGVQDDYDFQVSDLTIEQNDMLLFVSDGITDTNDHHGQMYSEKKLIELLKSNRNHDSQQLINTIEADVRNFMAGTEQTDDHTMLAIKIIR